MREYLLIVSKLGAQLSDILATAGIDAYHPALRGMTLPAPSCIIFGERAGEIVKGRAWIVTGFMEEAREAGLDGMRGILAWRRPPSRRGARSSSPRKASAGSTRSPR